MSTRKGVVSLYKKDKLRNTIFLGIAIFGFAIEHMCSIAWVNWWGKELEADGMCGAPTHQRNLPSLTQMKRGLAV